MHKVGEKVNTKKYGAGIIELVSKVEVPSDGDDTVYSVRFNESNSRNLKASDFVAAK